MATNVVFDLAKLRRSCAQCSLHQLCLPAGIDHDDLDRLDAIVRRHRPLARCERLYRIGDTMDALYVAREGNFTTVAINSDGEATEAKGSKALGPNSVALTWTVGATTYTATDNGFGVLTEIDVAATMKKKLDRDMPGYRILGACNPGMAWQAIGMEPKVGAMLPCNVILRAVEGGTEVSAIDPVASMAAIDNAGLKAVAGQVRDMLAKVVAEV